MGRTADVNENKRKEGRHRTNWGDPTLRERVRSTESKESAHTPPMDMNRACRSEEDGGGWGWTVNGRMSRLI